MAKLAVTGNSLTINQGAAAPKRSYKIPGLVDVQPKLTRQGAS